MQEQVTLQRRWISMHLTFSRWMEGILLAEGGGCVYRAVWFCLSPQDLGFQSMAVKHAQEKEDVCIWLFWTNCFAFTVWGTWRQAQEQQHSLYICENVRLVFYNANLFNNSSLIIAVLVEYVQMFPPLYSPFTGAVEVLYRFSGHVLTSLCDFPILPGDEQPLPCLRGVGKDCW